MIERIEVRGVTKLFGSTAALRAVSADFDRGTISFLEGGNGAGKSTLLGVMSTVLKPTRGSVSYGALGGERRRVRSRIGWVGHESHCYRDLTARENVALASRIFGVHGETAWSTLAGRLGLLGFADRNVSTLSRGQRQRVALARALVHSPDVLLLDEPWTGLDVATAERLSALLVEERDRGCIVVAVSHVAGHAETLAARRIQLERGQLVPRGPAPSGA